MSLETSKNEQVRDRRLEGLAAIFRIHALGKGGSKDVQNKATRFVSDLTHADRRGIEAILRSRNETNLEFLLGKLFPGRAKPAQITTTTPEATEIPSHSALHATGFPIIHPEDPVSTRPEDTQEAPLEPTIAEPVEVR